MSGSHRPAARSVGRALLWLGVVSAPALGATPAAAAEAAPSASPHFNVHEYRVLGNSVLESRDIERVLYPLLGDDKQLSDVDCARAALEKAYHQRGFGTVFVDVPPQEVGDDGVVRLRVTEGKLHASRIEGARYFAERNIAAAVPAARAGAVPNLTALQEQIAAVNSATPDRSVVPILKAGPDPGTADLQLRVDDRLPLHGSIELDDNYTAFTKPLRATVGLSYTDLFADLDSIAAQYQDSPQAPGEVGVFNTSYTSHSFGGGYRIIGSFIDSNSNVANVGVGSSGVLGKGQIYGLQLTYAPPLTERLAQSLALGWDYKHFRDTITAGGGGVALVTPISYSDVFLSYAGSWRTALADSSLTLTPSFGPRGAPNSPNAFENKQFLARPNFFYLRWDGSTTLHLPAGFGLLLRLAGQEATEPLISNENYSIGGADGVRGYLEAEELGDVALKGTVQLQSPVWSWHIPQLLRAFAFFDDGRMHEFGALPGQADHAELRSAGGGLYLLPTHAVNGMLIWADPLTNGSYTLTHQSRVLFTVQGAF